MNPSNLARTLLWLAVVSCTAGPALAEIKFPGQAGAARGSDTQARAGGGASAGIDSGAEAALREGLEYHRNSGVPMAPALARQRLKQAATAGDARGMVAYGWLLANGIGGLRDVEQAREWINEARIAGLARATFVSSLIEGRISGAKKRVESLQLLEQAARDGDAMAANNLGVAMELEGNLTGARTLYETAALQGNAVARENLERMRRLTRGGDALSLSRLRLQADDGDTDAMLQLAQRYHRGEGVQQDFAQAIQHYRRAADGGSQRARVPGADLQSPRARPGADLRRGVDARAGGARQHPVRPAGRRWRAQQRPTAPQRRPTGRPGRAARQRAFTGADGRRAHHGAAPCASGARRRARGRACADGRARGCTGALGRTGRRAGARRTATATGRCTGRARTCRRTGGGRINAGIDRPSAPRR